MVTNSVIEGVLAVYLDHYPNKTESEALRDILVMGLSCWVRQEGIPLPSDQ